jgi:hypothetical protein
MAANFSLSPGMATNDVIDYTTTAGQKVWEKAVEKLSDELFDCDSEGLRDFLELIRARGEVMGWNLSILSIPVDVNDPLGDAQDFLDHYGEVGLDHCREHALTYYNQHNRAAQDSIQLYTCLMKSISRVGRNKITGFRNQYTINGTACGILLLKIIIRESYIDTNATTTYIRDQLSSLDTFLPTVDYDIGKMNLHIQSLVEALNARGETTTDLLSNLFKGYKSATDERFLKYIALKEEYYEEGNNLGANELMNLAKNKWRVLKQKHLWNAPSPQEEKILALEAKIKKLESTRAPKSRQPKGTKPKVDNSTASQQQAPGPRTTPRYDPWMFVPPTDGETQPKYVGSKPFWWCTKHKKWCRHKTAKCEGKGIGKGQNKSSDSSQTKSSKKKKKQEIVRALGAAAQDDDEEEVTDSEDEE